MLLVHNAIHHVPKGDGWREVLVRGEIQMIPESAYKSSASKN